MDIPSHLPHLDLAHWSFGAFWTCGAVYIDASLFSSVWVCSCYISESWNRLLRQLRGKVQGVDAQIRWAAKSAKTDQDKQWTKNPEIELGEQELYLLYGMSSMIDRLPTQTVQGNCWEGQYCRHNVQQLWHCNHIWSHHKNWIIMF